jgi:hypothetical protein
MAKRIREDENDNKPPTEVEKTRERQSVDKVKFARAQQSDLANAQRKDLENQIRQKEQDAAEKERAKRLGLKAEGKPLSVFTKQVQLNEDEATQAQNVRHAIGNRLRDLRKQLKTIEGLQQLAADRGITDLVDPGEELRKAMMSIHRAIAAFN